MATPNQRKELSDHWFSMEHVARAFVKIRDSEFETVKMANLSKCNTFPLFAYTFFYTAVVMYCNSITTGAKLHRI